MSERNEWNTRREFMKSTATAAGTVALVSGLAGTEEAQAHEVEINAISPRPEQIQEFMALPDGPVVMVNLLKFKPDGGAEEYAKYGEGVGPILVGSGQKCSLRERPECVCSATPTGTRSLWSSTPTRRR